MPKEATPDIDIPIAYVGVAYEGISPTDAEKLLAKPLEKHLRTVAGLDKMTSASTEGYSSVTLEFDAGENIDLILDDVREAVDAAKPDLPDEADEPKITEINITSPTCIAEINQFHKINLGIKFWELINESN